MRGHGVSKRRGDGPVQLGKSVKKIRFFPTTPSGRSGRQVWGKKGVLGQPLGKERKKRNFNLPISGGLVSKYPE